MSSPAPQRVSELSHPEQGVRDGGRGAGVGAGLSGQEGALQSWGGGHRGSQGAGLGTAWRNTDGCTARPAVPGTGTLCCPQHTPWCHHADPPSPQSHYVACMAAILSQMDKDHYSSYIKTFPSRPELMVSSAAAARPGLSIASLPPLPMSQMGHLTAPSAVALVPPALVPSTAHILLHGGEALAAGW